MMPRSTPPARRGILELRELGRAAACHRPPSLSDGDARPPESLIKGIGCAHSWWTIGASLLLPPSPRVILPLPRLSNRRGYVESAEPRAAPRSFPGAPLPLSNYAQFLPNGKLMLPSSCRAVDLPSAARCK